jgi:alkanesulfonate monooxygenase SsuD/methylene tetrahydromethanopterin reductase-like flavin-dependent oxidoreductase (luciferase family)
MRLGMALPVFGLGGEPVDSGHFPRAAAAIEEAGYASLWVFDAIGRGFCLPDPLMALAVAATATRRVELGTGVIQLPIRNTAELAHRILTLHLLAGDRLLLGVGPGSTEADFEVVGEAFDGRMKRFAAELPRLRELLRSGRSGGADLTPWPATVGGPPLLIGAWRGPWVERAARDFDGWVASAMHNDDATLADALKRFREAGGERAIVTNVQLGAELGPALDRMSRLADMGFDDVVCLDLQPTSDRIVAIPEALGRDAHPPA